MAVNNFTFLPRLRPDKRRRSLDLQDSRYLNLAHDQPTDSKKGLFNQSARSAYAHEDLFTYPNIQQVMSPAQRL